MRPAHNQLRANFIGLLERRKELTSAAKASIETADWNLLNDLLAERERLQNQCEALATRKDAVLDPDIVAAAREQLAQEDELISLVKQALRETKSQLGAKGRTTYGAAPEIRSRFIDKSH